MSKKRAFTLLEMVVGSFVMLLAGALLARIFTLVRSTERVTTAAYAVTGEADTAISNLRQSLQETSLVSVVTFPKRQGVSFNSARSAETDKDPGHLLVGEYGVPRWCKHVFFGLRGDARHTELVRWEQPFSAAESDRLPHLMDRWPSPPARARVLMHNVVRSGENISDLATVDPDDWGGFRVQFVRRHDGSGGDYLSDDNPRLGTGKLQDTTGLVELQLATVEALMGKSNYYSITFRVAPRF